MLKPYTNDTKAPMYVGATLIQPGDTRMIDDRLLPPNLPTAAAPEPPPPPDFLSVLDANVETVLSGLAALSDDELAQVEAAELAGKTRKGVLEGISADRFRRAAERGDQSGDGS